MSSMQAEMFEAFRSIGVSDDKASAAAQALSRRDPDMSALLSDVAALKVDMAVLKWMMGFMLAGMLAIILKTFVH